MEIVSGITTHTIVVCVDKRDRGMALQGLLEKKGFHVIPVFSLYDGLREIQQEMPHLVICDSILSDGTAGTLYDRIGQHETLKNTPILVLVAKKSSEHLTPLTGRKFAGFLLGQFDGNSLISKVNEVLGSASHLSPYFVSFDHTEMKPTFTINVDAKILGLSGEQVIYQSDTEIDSTASLVCVPEDSKLSPVLLNMGTNIVPQQGGGVYNMFPLNRVKGKGRKWVVELPSIDLDQSSDQSSKGPSKVLFFDPNQARFDQFKKVLSGYNMDLIHAPNLQKATQLLQRDAGSLGAAYFHELPGVQMATVKSALDKVDGQKPMLIVGTSSLNMKSTAEIIYIKKPFGLGVLVEMLESAIKASSTSADDLSKSHQAVNLECNYQAPAKLIGLDETGGIIQLKFPVVKGNRLKLDHPFLSKIWDGDILAEITHTGSLPSKPDVWQARFMAVSSKGNKAKYWEKVEKLLQEDFPSIAHHETKESA